MRGLHLSIRSQSATWAFEYKLPGLHPDTGRRWPTRTLTLGKLAPSFHLEEAREVALTAKALVMRGVDPLGERKAELHKNIAAVAAAEREQTVADLVRAYRARREAGWRTATRAAFKGDLQVIVDHIGPLPISGVTRRQLVNLVDDFHTAQVEAGGRGTRAARIAMLLGSLFRDAMDRGLLELSPAQALPRPVAHRSRSRVLDAEEIALVWRTLRQASGHGVGAPARLALLLSLVTGQRIGTVGSACVDELALDGAGDQTSKTAGPCGASPARTGARPVAIAWCRSVGSPSSCGARRWRCRAGAARSSSRSAAGTRSGTSARTASRPPGARSCRGRAADRHDGTRPAPLGPHLVVAAAARADSRRARAAAGARRRRPGRGSLRPCELPAAAAACRGGVGKEAGGNERWRSRTRRHGGAEVSYIPSARNSHLAGE